MDNIHHKGKEYAFVTAFRDDAVLREQFNQLTARVYGFDFEKWHLSGFWKDNYIPYALHDGERMVSNVSISIIDFWVNGKIMTFGQIGTVMTDPDSRHLGLNKLLLGKVLEDWQEKCDLIYLFANNTVLDFYPKFGFRRVEQYQHSKPVGAITQFAEAQKLDMSLADNKSLLNQKITESAPNSWLSMRNNAGLVMFYYTCFDLNDVYYIDALDTVVIAEQHEDTLCINDVFCDRWVDIDEVIASLANSLTKQQTKRVVLGFTPLNAASYTAEVLVPDDVLFVLEDKQNVFESVELMFPVLSHA